MYLEKNYSPLKYSFQNDFFNQISIIIQSIFPWKGNWNAPLVYGFCIQYPEDRNIYRVQLHIQLYGYFYILTLHVHVGSVSLQETTSKFNSVAYKIRKMNGEKISNARWNNVSTLSIRNIRYTLSVYDVLHTRTLYVVGLHAEIDNAIVRRRGDSNGTYWNGVRIERI